MLCDQDLGVADMSSTRPIPGRGLYGERVGVFGRDADEMELK
jgi:hypothetical protein